MEFVVYIYASKSPARELRAFRCPCCGRIVFRHNSRNLLLSNALGASFKTLEPGTHFTEHKCHSCKAKFNILYQK
jgi:DNA-directed RNA polymerase subunit RPC12/RpoP